MENKIEEIQKRILELKLVISRVPRKTKEDFVALANSEFCGDYGMCLKWCYEQAMEKNVIKSFFENVDFKLDYIIGGTPQSEQKPETDTIKMVNGRIVEKGGDKHGKFK